MIKCSNCDNVIDDRDKARICPECGHIMHKSDERPATFIDAVMHTADEEETE